MRLQGKRAIITGAASGIGRAGALLFAKEGAAVVAVDRDTAGLASLMREIEGAGGWSRMLVADLTRPADARQLIHQGAKLLGGLDIFWANAGINGPDTIEQQDLLEHNKTLALNLTSPTVSCGEAVPLMREGGGGAIVFTASIAGLVGSIQSPLYSATKFALVGLAKSMALKYAAEKIRVNAVCPGPVETPLLRETFIKRNGLAGAESLEKQMLASVPLGRVGLAHEIAEAALWLASDASSFVTGVALPVDGGLTAR